MGFISATTLLWESAESRFCLRILPVIPSSCLSPLSGKLASQTREQSLKSPETTNERLNDGQFARQWRKA
jgi:hypothetical protein